MISVTVILGEHYQVPEVMILCIYTGRLILGANHSIFLEVCNCSTYVRTSKITSNITSYTSTRVPQSVHQVCWIVSKSTVNSKSSTSGGVRTIRHGECKISVSHEILVTLRLVLMLSVPVRSPVTSPVKFFVIVEGSLSLLIVPDEIFDTPPFKLVKLAPDPSVSNSVPAEFGNTTVGLPENCACGGACNLK